MGNGFITAWETLGNPTRRRAFDSVDPEFDEAVPQNNAESKENFYDTFGPVFERNARYVDCCHVENPFAP